MERSGTSTLEGNGVGVCDIGVNLFFLGWENFCWLVWRGRLEQGVVLSCSVVCLSLKGGYTLHISPEPVNCLFFDAHES